MSIGNILNVTDDQIHNFFQLNKKGDNPIRVALHDEVEFFQLCDRIKVSAGMHFEYLGSLNLTSDDVAEKIEYILKKAQSLPENTNGLIDGTFKVQIDGSAPVIENGVFKFTPWKHQKDIKCHFCNEKFEYNIITISNVILKQSFEFHRANLHAFKEHYNFEFPGNRARYKMEIGTDIRVLNLVKPY
jgi:hypothetical protein